MPHGGSIALAGLMRDNILQTSNGTSSLKNLPLVGTLFSQRSVERNETELVIIATAYLVRPNQLNSFSRPGDNFSPGSALLMGRINKLYGGVSVEPKPPFAGRVGSVYK